MRVALFVHCFFPEHFYGTETYTYELARNLKAMGHEPTVVSAVFQGEPPREALVTRYEFKAIPVVFDRMQIDDKPLPAIDATSAFKEDFVSITERETFWQRFKGTMGKRVKREVKEEKKEEKNKKVPAGN